MLLAENTANYDRRQRDQLRARRAVFAAADHVARSRDPAASLFTSLTPAGLDWTPPRAPRRIWRGHGGITAGVTGGFFGGAMPNTTYFGAADPAGAKWWEGWTNYATQ